LASTALGERLAALYAAFNARRIDTILEQMSGEVDWPNAWEGGRLQGKQAVRDYWTRQWAEIDPTVEPRAFTTLPDGRVAVDVRQTVRSLDGARLGEGDVRHVYAFDGDLVTRMDVEETADPSA
jgi:hypothetical protein